LDEKFRIRAALIALAAIPLPCFGALEALRKAKNV
jgi:hypothetical protein